MVIFEGVEVTKEDAIKEIKKIIDSHNYEDGCDTWTWLCMKKSLEIINKQEKKK